MGLYFNILVSFKTSNAFPPYEITISALDCFFLIFIVFLKSDERVVVLGL